MGCIIGNFCFISSWQTSQARPVVCISKSTGFTCQLEPTRTGTLGAPVNVDNYGRHVTNYTAADLKWRLFYEDSNNIYLISETSTGNYPLKTSLLNSDYSAKGNYSSGANVSQQGKDLMPLLGGATSSSAGIIEIGINTNGINLLTSSNTNPNILATAYLCDIRADGPWSAYKLGNAAWAMGGPTIELFAASYNATHTNHQISLRIGTYGYNNNTEPDWFLTSENYGIYRLKNSGDYWWLIGCNDSQDYYYYGVQDYFGGLSVNGLATRTDLYARPVVCIQKSTGFTCNFGS